MIDAATPAFGRRLAIGAAPPLVLALSGGGDSLALLLMAKAWADGAGRRLVAVTVDHRLQADGASWAAWCAERAARLGVEHRTLTWEGAKPSTGLPAASRTARHALIAETARALDASVVLMAHTGDDRAEAAAMRAAGSTTPTPREWSPSPAWPQGRGVFILRPLLDTRREALRTWLSALGETWIEDPANDDPRFARARARRSGVAPDEARPCTERPTTLDTVEADAAGLAAPREAFAASEGRALLGAMLLCASGTTRPPRSAAVNKLLASIRAGAPFVATLAGARVEGDAGRVRVMRDPGDILRRGVAEAPLPRGSAVWDGRFEIEAKAEGLRIAPLGGLASRLAPKDRLALKTLPPAARRALPAVLDPSGSVTCPILAQDGPATARSLVLDRLSAWSGAIDSEEAIWRVAKAGRTS